MNVACRFVSWASIVSFFLTNCILQMVGVGLSCDIYFSEPFFQEESCQQDKISMKAISIRPIRLHLLSIDVFLIIKQHAQKLSAQ